MGDVDAFKIDSGTTKEEVNNIERYKPRIFKFSHTNFLHSSVPGPHVLTIVKPL
jgi:hypothetical protein